MAAEGEESKIESPLPGKVK